MLLLLLPEQVCVTRVERNRVHLDARAHPPLLVLLTAALASFLPDTLQWHRHVARTLGELRDVALGELRS